jgi:hypothetical protein
MSIRDVIIAINQMEADGVIDRYAIGGAVGATFYLEPVDTFDVDVFVALERAAESQLLTLQPIFEYLRSRGGVIEREYIVVGGYPVQILPPTSPLAEEAILAAIECDVDGIQARVFTPEHLAAISLETGRAKDKARLLQFVEEGALNFQQFEAILQHHGLMEKWHRFRLQFLDSET